MRLIPRKLKELSTLNCQVERRHQAPTLFLMHWLLVHLRYDLLCSIRFAIADMLRVLSKNQMLSFPRQPNLQDSTIALNDILNSVVGSHISAV